MDSTLYFLLQKNSCSKLLLAGTVVALKNMYLLLPVFLRLINGSDVTR